MHASHQLPSFNVTGFENTDTAAPAADNAATYNSTVRKVAAFMPAHSCCNELLM
jgi:hypothetical protein